VSAAGKHWCHKLTCNAVLLLASVVATTWTELFVCLVQLVDAAANCDQRAVSELVVAVVVCCTHVLCCAVCLCVLSMEWGGSNIRPEATGYGAVYFGDEILKDQGETFEVSGEWRGGGTCIHPRGCWD